MIQIIFVFSTFFGQISVIKKPPWNKFPEWLLKHIESLLD